MPHAFSPFAALYFIEKLQEKPDGKAGQSLLSDPGDHQDPYQCRAKAIKMRPVDIVGTLCNLMGMTAADIGVITILDVSTFVEILNNKRPSGAR